MAQTIIIAGAGIVGVATALWLQRADPAGERYQIILMDPNGPAGGTSAGNGGVLASVGVVPVTTPGLMAKALPLLLKRHEPLFLRWSYLPRLLPFLRPYLSHANKRDVERISKGLATLLWDALDQHRALASGTEAERFLHPGPYLYLYKDSQAALADGYAWHIRYRRGFRWQDLEGDALTAFDPAFGTGFGFARLMDQHGRISDPAAYVKALAASFVEAGGTLVHEAVDEVICDKRYVTAIRSGGRILPCDHFILTSGIWSSPLAKRLGLQPIMESERGYHVEFMNPSIMPKAPTMVASGKFVLTPMEGRLRAAGIVEFGGLSASESEPPFNLLIQQTKATLPGLTYDRLERWMGHRPAPSDSLPLIGRLTAYDNALVGFGHHHIGLTGGAKTGRILASLLADQPLDMDLAPYDPNRFQPR